MTTVPGHGHGQLEGTALAGYSSDQLLAMLAKERRSITNRIVVLRGEIRERNEELAELTTRMRDIEASEDYLAP